MRNSSTDNRVIIAGGGIGGLAAALTLHQIGVPCIVFEAVREMRPLGVGINLQPNAVRELYDLGITAGRPRPGRPAGQGMGAGRTERQRHLLRAARQARRLQLAAIRGASRAGSTCCCTTRSWSGWGRRRCDSAAGSPAIASMPTAASARCVEHADGSTSEPRGALLIGADGIHSAVRAQMHPGQPPIHWGGAVMWRGTTWGKPIRTGSSFVGLGTHRQRMVFYPISHPDPRTGLSMINWIAEVTMDNSEGWKQSGWFRQVPTSDFVHHFDGWVWDWLDVPALIRGADSAFENPMIDRDPVPTWRDGPVVLLGDAAHPMYPTGSNGGSQAIVDARVLGACMVEHGVTPAALEAYDAKLCGPISQLILRNRGAGPFGLLNMVDERCGGTFDNIDDVIPAAERTAFMAGYKAAAGFAIETLNKAPPTLAPGARARTAATV